MPRKGKTKDPHAAREAAKYDNPIPSREFILNLLDKAKKPLTASQLRRELKIDGEVEIEALSRRLRAMERDAQLMVNRRGAYGIVDKMDLIRGRIQGHRDGYGFLIPIDGSDDLYLSGRQMARVFDGDEVLAREVGLDRRGRREGKIVEVLQHNTTRVVGRFVDDGGVAYVVPDNARINHDILIPAGSVGGAQSGQIVTAEISNYPAPHKQAKGTVVEVLGEHLDPGMEIDVAIRSHAIPYLWPEEVEREAGALDDEPAEADKDCRIDCRSMPFVTIDGEDARDFDDAVYCKPRRGDSWKLWVAIADVSHYVRPGSALDAEATNRATSVYFPERVVPMLPEVLSNGLCSLKPGVDRLALVCEMKISADGELGDSVFYEAVIHSHARLTYTQVGEALENGSSPAIDKKILPHIKNLHNLYQVLRKARDRRGAIDFETVETRIIFDQLRKIEAIVPVQRNDAHKLIEECMLSANVAAAGFLQRHKLPGLYRVHEGPTTEKLENLRKFLGELGLDLAGGEKPTPVHYRQLLNQIDGREDAALIQTMLLRSLRQAVYQPENLGHFGLHYDAYAHFTSPIRRYPDLLMHRALRHVIRSNTRSKWVERVKGAVEIPATRIYPYDLASMLVQGEHSSMAERRADDATRDVEAWLKCEYLQDRVGETFEGVVAAVTSFGLFVELADLYIEGLVHISALPGDYYHFDQAKQRLTGERTNRSFRLGDSVTVQVARVDLDDKKIDLEMIDSSKKKGSSKLEGKKPKAVKKSGNKPAKSGKSNKPKAKGSDTKQKGRQRRR
jgi:ribonuclease R